MYVVLGWPLVVTMRLLWCVPVQGWVARVHVPIQTCQLFLLFTQSFNVHTGISPFAGVQIPQRS